MEQSQPGRADCPDTERLRWFWLGKLAGRPLAAVAEHLDVCPECQTILRALSAEEDGFVARVRAVAAPQPYADEPECRQAVRRVQAIAMLPARGDDSEPPSPEGPLGVQS